MTLEQIDTLDFTTRDLKALSQILTRLEIENEEVQSIVDYLGNRIFEKVEIL